jgi:hypothetical protein
MKKRGMSEGRRVLLSDSTKSKCFPGEGDKKGVV